MRELQKTITAIAMGTSLNKNLKEQSNGYACALQIFVNFFASSAKQQREMIKLCVVRRMWTTRAII